MFAFVFELIVPTLTIDIVLFEKVLPTGFSSSTVWASIYFIIFVIISLAVIWSILEYFEVGDK